MIKMLDEISRFSNMQVYTNQGVQLGTVENVVLDVTNSKVDALYISGTNPILVEDSVNLNVPYRWIQAVGDIIILKYFPGKVALKKETEEKVEEE
ncbi:MAG: PRC-barrel domain-containing protein [Candidatus Thermoplasmatota archaeon]|nr:photosystem reaction center subunit H [archaeon]MBU3902388.1 PRC-barrel domain-containing protein [Candidatus Thermoplasmatota archaeon]